MSRIYVRDPQANLRLAQETNDGLFGKSFLHAQYPGYVIGLESVVLLKDRETPD